MFAFDRSAMAVLLPLAMLLAVVVWSNQSHTPAAAQQARAERGDDVEAAATPRDQTVAANLPSR
jgi:hypothetical protein